MTSSKRPRTPSYSSNGSSGSPTTSPQSKTTRTNTTHRLLCTLPPTCNHRATPIAGTRDLETHYATYHAHVCEEGACGCVFPDEKLLELHQTECHDPIAAVRKEKGEKIFACHVATCTRLFLTPKARRLHLIQAHEYPKEYFFAVTNKGIGGLLKRWGEGASMIRGEWKARERREVGDDMDSDEKDEGENKQNDSESESEDDDDDHGTINGDPRPHPHHQQQERMDTGADEAMNGLTNSLNALALVPPSIRFGRGGKNGGFVHSQGPDQGRGGHGSRGGRGGRTTRGGGPGTMDIDTPNTSNVGGGRGQNLGWAGRGRAGILNVRGANRGGRGRGRAMAMIQSTRGGLPTVISARGKGRGVLA